MSAPDLIAKAIQKAGSEEKLGAAIGYTQHGVWRAKRRGRVTPEMAVALDRWSGGEFSKHDLRPDLFGPRPSEQARVA